MTNKLQHNLTLNCLCNLNGLCLLLFCVPEILKMYSSPNVLWSFILLWLHMLFCLHGTSWLYFLPCSKITVPSNSNSRVTILPCYHPRGVYFDFHSRFRSCSLRIPVVFYTYVLYCKYISIYKSRIMWTGIISIIER